MLIKYFDALLRENYNSSLPEFSEVILTEMAIKFQVSRGAFFILNRKKQRLQATAAYGLLIGQLEVAHFKAGEGLLGECMQRKEVIYLEELPKKTIVNTSLASLHSTSIIIIPLVFNDEVVGLIELVSPKKITEAQKTILQEITENIASVLVNFLANLENRQLVERLKNQTKRLHDKEAQLIQNIEKLKATQEEMRTKQEQLEQANIKIGKQRTQIEETFNSLHHQNQQVTDSIRYAQTIQQSILPYQEKLTEYFFDHFVIYKPKDIVSGDFFWFSYTNNRMFIASIDCTGHGVPGAFMSLIGHSQLNATVNEKRIYEPSMVLELLHFKVQKILRQDTTHKENINHKMNTDGMDVCFCSIEYSKEKIIVRYAGAKLPLYIVTPDKVLKYIKGDKRSIGGDVRKNTAPFTNQTEEVPSGTAIYLTTDGYIDQNNFERKRIGTTKVKTILTQIAHMPMDKQKTKLEDFLANHQQNEKQRDDITFIGIRL